MPDNNSEGSTDPSKPSLFTPSADLGTRAHPGSRGSMMSNIRVQLPKRFVRLALISCLAATIAIIYVTMFRHPPPDQLMRMNSGKAKDFGIRAFRRTGKSHSAHVRELTFSKHQVEDDGDEKDADVLDMLGMGDDEEEQEDAARDEKDVDDGDGGDENDEAIPPKGPEVQEGRVEELKGKVLWDKFISDNHHTVIGIVFDSCDTPTVQLGTVVLLPDAENGGVMSRTFYNFTLDRVIDEGWTFNIDVKYNGQNLYDNWWDVCEMEEDLEPEQRTFVCPIQPGKLSLVKDKHIPGYLPKGRYQTKAWVKDPKESIIVCGVSDFQL